MKEQTGEQKTPGVENIIVSSTQFSRSIFSKPKIRPDTRIATATSVSLYQTITRSVEKDRNSMKISPLLNLSYIIPRGSRGKSIGVGNGDNSFGEIFQPPFVAGQRRDTVQNQRFNVLPSQSRSNKTELGFNGEIEGGWKVDVARDEITPWDNDRGDRCRKFLRQTPV